MKKKIFLHLFILLFTISSKNAISQGRLGFLAGTGVIFYNGDINEKSDKIISPSKVFKPFFRLGIIYRLSQRWEASVTLFYGNVGGADSLATELDNRIRNLSFKSEIEELALHLEYKLFPAYKMTLLNPYVFAGFGFFHFNPKAQLNNTWFNLQPIGTEGQYIVGGGYETPYKLIEKVVPLGIGISFQLNRHWRLRIDYSNHFTFTDHLDDVSTVHPDSALLAAAPNGALAIQLSNRRLDGKYPKTNRPRGNPDFNDSYSHIGITVIYNPGEFYMGKTFRRSQFGRKSSKRMKMKLNCPVF